MFCLPLTGSSFFQKQRLSHHTVSSSMSISLHRWKVSAVHSVIVTLSARMPPVLEPTLFVLEGSSGLHFSAVTSRASTTEGCQRELTSSSYEHFVEPVVPAMFFQSFHVTLYIIHYWRDCRQTAPIRRGNAVMDHGSPKLDYGVGTCHYLRIHF